MRRFPYIGFMLSVMLVLCVLRWKAQADLVDPELFSRSEPGASFDLFASGDKFVLTITPKTSGHYYYYFTRISGDMSLVEDAYAGICTQSRDFTEILASFPFGKPEEGGTIHYRVEASFIPLTEFVDVPDKVSDDNVVSDDDVVSDDNDVISDDAKETASADNRTTTSSDTAQTSGGGGGGSCSIYTFRRSIWVRFEPVFFRASADISNVNGTVYVNIDRKE